MFSYVNNNFLATFHIHLPGTKQRVRGCQKRPIKVSKESHYNVKRDLLHATFQIHLTGKKMKDIYQTYIYTHTHMPPHPPPPRDVRHIGNYYLHRKTFFTWQNCPSTARCTKSRPRGYLLSQLCFPASLEKTFTQKKATTILFSRVTEKKSRPRGYLFS